jgi:hypothetical protein
MMLTLEAGDAERMLSRAVASLPHRVFPRGCVYKKR